VKQDISPQIDAADFADDAREMLAALETGSFADALTAGVRKINRAVAENFVEAGSPHGGAWPARKDPTLKHPLEILSGALFQAETEEFGRGHIQEVGAREAFTGATKDEVPYLFAQNFGRPEINLPARLSEDVSDETIDATVEDVADRGLELLMGR
jgi:hypothetical protein